MQDSISNIEQSTVSPDSENSFSFDLAPVKAIDKNYWIEEFAMDAYNITVDYHENRVFNQGSLKANNPNWLVIIFIFCFTLIAFVRGFHRKRLGLLTKALLNWKFGKQIIRYEKLYTHPVNLVLVINFLIATPIFFALSYNEFSENLFGLFNSSLLLTVYLLVFSVFKLLSYKVSAWVFDCIEEMREYIFQANLIAKFLGVTYLALALLLSYSKINPLVIFWVGVAALIVGIGLQVIRGFLIALQKSKDLILIILYLCTLEILPLVIMGKLVLNAL